MIKHFNTLLLPAFLALLYASAASASGPLGPITSIAISENGIGPESEGCRSFSVTPDQVKTFFDTAILISGRQNHDYFLYGPCSATGTLKNRYGTWHWELRNMGTASITAMNGEVFLLGDPTQESSLAEDGNGP